MTDTPWFLIPTTSTAPDLRAAGFDTLEQATAVVAGLTQVRPTAPTRRSRPAAERSAA